MKLSVIQIINLCISYGIRSQRSLVRFNMKKHVHSVVCSEVTFQTFPTDLVIHNRYLP